jgi:prevent-host-death family protein
VSNVTTKIIPISDLRQQASQVIQLVQREGDVVIITQHSRPAVVLVDYEHYEGLLVQLEDLANLASLEAGADEPAREYEDFLTKMDNQ